MGKKRQSELTEAAQVLKTLLSSAESQLSEPFLRWKIWRAWPEVVGEELARSTEPVGYYKGTLYIWVSSASRLQEITFIIKSLQEKINTYSNKRWIRSIRLTLDRRSVPKIAEVSDEIKDYLK